MLLSVLGLASLFGGSMPPAKVLNNQLRNNESKIDIINARIQHAQKAGEKERIEKAVAKRARKGKLFNRGIA